MVIINTLGGKLYNSNYKSTFKNTFFGALNLNFFVSSRNYCGIRIVLSSLKLSEKERTELEERKKYETKLQNKHNKSKSQIFSMIKTNSNYKKFSNIQSCKTSDRN